jgi:predicted nucleotidyltransferase
MLEELLSTSRFRTWAEEYAQRVVLAYQPACIILFGSVARNQHTTNSDIDILVIGGDLPQNQQERFRKLIRLRPVLAPLQVQTFTCAEWEAMLSEKHVTTLEALQDGIPLYGKTLFAGWRRQFRSWLKMGMRRVEGAWIISPVQRQTISPKERLHG